MGAAKDMVQSEIDQYKFTGDDAELQNLRSEFANNVAALLDNGVDTENAQAIQKLADECYQKSLNYDISYNLAKGHIELIDSLSTTLKAKINELEDKGGKQKALVTIDKFHDDMVSEINLQTELQTSPEVFGKSLEKIEKEKKPYIPSEIPTLNIPDMADFCDLAYKHHNVIVVALAAPGSLGKS